jgi:predicted metalloprotease with PDZ domain
MTVVAGAALAAFSAAAQASSITYTITPEMTAGRLAALDVEVRVVTDGASVTLKPPTALKAVEQAKTGWVVKADRPVAAIRYRVPASASDKATSEGQAPVLRAGWFAMRGEDLLAAPEHAAATSATVRMSGFSRGWTAAVSAEGPMPAAKVGDVLLIGGRGYRSLERTVDGSRVRLAYPQTLADRAPGVLERASRVLTAESRFWGDAPRPYFIGLIEPEDTGDYSGRGVAGGFALWLGKDVSRDVWMRLIAHEDMHSWVSRRIGGFPAKDDDLEAWLNEGFTEAYMARILLQSGLWSPQQFVDDWNVSLARYGLSPVRTAPNARIQADRFRDFDVQKLPYDRGRLLALRWDAQFRAATGGAVGMYEVLRGQMREAAESEVRGAVVSADRLFPVVARRLTGVDLSAELARYVDDGQAMTIAPDAFGPCVRVVEVTQPVFDRGFDMAATERAHGRLTGLEPGGPAEKAGLHEGDRLLIDEAPTRDSRVTLTYQVVESGGRRRTVSYRPLGTAQITFQQLEFQPSALGSAEACGRSMLRP